MHHYLPIEDEQSLIDVEIDTPEVSGQDILVAVKAIAVNPVDTKVRSPKSKVEGNPRILGWDAAGEVIAVGSKVTDYAIGDEVYYAGDITRAGANCEFQLVDERIVGQKPKTLSFAEAAALPLTSITAWEALFDRLGISQTGKNAGQSILMIGAAGGVGSIAIQLASQLAKLDVIATASREESHAWCLELGAQHVINHYQPLNEALRALDIRQVDYILCLNHMEQHWQAMAEVIAPQGRICSIVESPGVDLSLLKSKSATFVWEFMFTRAMYQTPDIIEQQKLLNQISVLIDQGDLITTVKQILRPINAKNLRQAHTTIEQGHCLGKIVLADWF